MRVLLVTDWPRLPGGTERYVDDLRAGLEAAGHDVRLLASSVGAGAGGTADYVARGTDRRAAQAMLQVANPSAVRAVRHALREFEPDAVHVAMILGYLSPAALAPLRDRTATMMTPDLKPVCPKGTKLLPDGTQCRVAMGGVCRRSGCLSTPRAARDWVRYRAFRHGAEGLDRMVAPSRHMRGELALVGIEAEHVPLPVPAPPHPSRSPAPDPHLVYAGRLAPVKGVGLLLEAFGRLRRRHPRATLTICGDGVDRDAVDGGIRDLGLGSAVSVRRGMSSGWLEELEAAWALVAPSLYREPLGLTAIEAIVRDVPVVASGDGGFGETVVEGRSGLLFRNGDADGLTERLTEVCEGAFPGHRPEAEARAELVRRHDPGDHVRAMERIWREARARSAVSGALSA